MPGFKTKLKPKAYFDGFGRQKNILDIEDIIRKDFTFKHEPDEANRKMLEQITSANSAPYISAMATMPQK